MSNALFVSVTFGLALCAGIFLLNRESENHLDAPKSGWEKKAELETAHRMAQLSKAENRLANWPPVIGRTFPRVNLFDHEDKHFSFDSLQGKPTVVEFIAMSCAGCQAFAGANKYGGFGGFASQAELSSFEEYFEKYTKHELHSDELNFVQIIFYDLQLRSPSANELADWREHFHLKHHPNTFVVSGGPALANQVSFAMIPGFMLLDENQTVRYDSTGHHPTHNLYTELLPAVRKMLESSR